MPDYTLIDLPPILNLIFYPRKDFSPCPENAFDLNVPVDKDVFVSTRFYVGGANQPWVIYFHGNGEVVSDYDDIAPVYNQLGLNLVVADYRGYGASGGTPSFTNVCHDAKSIFTAATREISNRGFQQELWVMGRSLGSISALELANQYPDAIKGMIIESGFANVVRIMKHLDHFPKEVTLRQFDQECLDLVKNISIPVLVIHGKDDYIVPYEEALDLYENLGTTSKTLVTIPDAGHNDIMYVGLRQYFKAIQEFISNALGTHKGD
ncbi:MAG: esterase [Pelotomaculum sp. PtaB.Bin013]|uniref:Lysophospholipase n=1 Tax=Pelotomaculum isophthalicicum JI TaxID=947010 RepID=A0A9X4H581_9FIRM|nr:alpha/beta fold hydrolase [Pelotomaculum isophthalicicum]MDF9408252.1 lysophospholipase [Pelotomaculum isophthalicicum JI]OPX91866.1 MAG: esterase [Pelotomaculum sp. PtaB.Bin013]